MFYQSEEIVWTPYRLMASTNHVIVSTAPVSDDEAINMLHNAVTKSNSLTGVPQKRTYLRPYFTDEAINQILEQGGVNVLLPITPDDPTYLKVIYYYSATGFFVSEQIEHYDGDNSVRATVIAYFITQDNRWLVKSIAYETSSISPPPNH